MAEMSFAQAMRDYFGPRVPGSNAADFMAELKALNDADKVFFRSELARVGYQLKA